jgi:hypothetical protein
MDQDQHAGEQEGENDQGEDSVAPATAPLEIRQRTAQICENVQIGEVGADDQCGRAQSRAPT